MPFALTFSGDFNHLSGLFTELEKFVAVQNEKIKVKGRLMRVDSVTIAPRPGAGAGALTANVTASTFIVPRATGVRRLPRPDTPDPAAGTTPTTTAAVTGAIE